LFAGRGVVHHKNFLGLFRRGVFRIFVNTFIVSDSSDSTLVTVPLGNKIFVKHILTLGTGSSFIIRTGTGWSRTVLNYLFTTLCNVRFVVTLHVQLFYVV